MTKVVSIALYEALRSINVPADKARAVTDAVEAEMFSTFSTKTEIHTVAANNNVHLAEFREDVNDEMSMQSKRIIQLDSQLANFTEKFTHQLETRELKTTIKLTSIGLMIGSILFAALHWFPHVP